MPSSDRDSAGDVRYAELLEREIDSMEHRIDLLRTLLVGVVVAGSVLGVDALSAQAAVSAGVPLAVAAAAAGGFMALWWYFRRRRDVLKERLSSYEGREEEHIEKLRAELGRLQAQLASRRSKDEELEARLGELEALVQSAAAPGVGRVVGGPD